MKTKICSKCGLEKDFLEYNKRKKAKDGIRTACKICEKQYTIDNKEKIRDKKKIYYNNNKEKHYKKCRENAIKNHENIKKYHKEYYNKNKEVIQQYKKEYDLENKEKIKKYRKNYYETNKKEILKKQQKYNSLRKKHNVLKSYKWRSKNRNRWIQTRAIRNKYRYENDINFKLKKNIISQINININNKYKSHKTKELLGCTIDELKQYLESKFTKGMTWENRGQFGWHIDHIKPCSSFNLLDPEEQKKCFHYSNLQPLWATTKIAISYGENEFYVGNIEKSNKT